jgi:hypothetical protein
MPAEFTAGVNTIKFKGNPSLFVNESQVEIEILDSNGAPIYYETGLDLESAQQNAVVNVFINQDTAPGIGTVYICGTISKDATGKALPPSSLNLRWSAPISVDISKRNSVDILYEQLPTVTIASTSGAYTNLGYPGNTRIVSKSVSLASGDVTYFNYNDQPLLSTGSRATFAFTSSAISANVIITSANLTNVSPALPSNLGVLTYSSSIRNYSGSGIAYLTDPIVFKNPRGIENYIVKSAGVSGFTYTVEQSASLPPATTENSFNTAVVYFNNLSPSSGQVAKIRSYYKSSGVGEYVFSNETDITSFAAEDGFTPSTFTASFAIPTTHRNDRLDFKFEFVNPSGLVSKQVLESKNHLFLGGNTYVGGDDNLLTGSLYVAGSTGTGVHISGKGSAAMIRSIGYNGFQRATTTGPGGFVMYSGSIQPLLSASESYSGVGLELVANSASYFKYTTSGSGLLDIRTANFFLGNESNSISGSNGNILISGSNVRVSTPTFYLGSDLTYVSGSGNNIKIATSKQDAGYVLPGGDPWTGPYYQTFTSGSITLSGSNVNINTPTIQIGTDANYIRAANGQITIASGYGQIGESYQLIGDPFELPSYYDLLPVYGNGSILISGSNVDIKTPKFFLGDSTTSISGSNGNIRISGSNIDVLTSKFFLGNPSTFISGSGNNIRISGSNVTVSTPSFIFGNQTTFISGSNGTILISGSNLELQTPSFLLGTSASYVSSSNGYFEIYSQKFIVTDLGIVTASGIFVPKGLNNVSYPMINTEQYYIDSPNIGRVVAFNDETEYTYSTSSFFSNAYSTSDPTTSVVFISDPFKTVKFQHLFNETKLAVGFNLKFNLTSSYNAAGTPIVGRLLQDSKLKARIYYQETGSLLQTIPSAGSYQTWTDSGFDLTVWAGLNSSIQNVSKNQSITREYNGVGKNMGIYTVPRSLYTKKLRLDFYWSGSIAAGNTTSTHVTASFWVTELEVLAGGMHTFNLNRYDPTNVFYTVAGGGSQYEPPGEDFNLPTD